MCFFKQNRLCLTDDLPEVRVLFVKTFSNLWDVQENLKFSAAIANKFENLSLFIMCLFIVIAQKKATGGKAKKNKCT